MTQKTVSFTGETKITAMRLVGIALLWMALSALAYVPASSDTLKATIVAVLGFAAFATGLSLFADALKRGIIAKVGQENRG
jgi:hypothetical protein